VIVDLLVRVATPEDGRLRPKHVVDEYTQDKYKNNKKLWEELIAYFP
jgi:hypothetical protein